MTLFLSLKNPHYFDFVLVSFQDGTALEGYDVQSDEATADTENEEIDVYINFGFESHGAQIVVMDKNCENTVGDVLTLETASDTDFAPELVLKRVFTTIKIHSDHLADSGNENVVFPTDGSSASVSGEIIFCVKAHSTEEATDTDGETMIIEMEVEKTRYTVRYDGANSEFSTFSLDTDIVAEAIVEGESFDDGELLASGTIVYHRCTADSTEDSGLDTPVTEEFNYYLCLAPSSDDFVLSDINLDGLYGTDFSETLPLVIGSAETLSVVIVELDAGNGYTRITVPILSEFIESGGDALQLSGDADVGFVQGRMAQERVEFEIMIELDGAKEIGCFSKFYQKVRNMFF